MHALEPTVATGMLTQLPCAAGPRTGEGATAYTTGRLRTGNASEDQNHDEAHMHTCREHRRSQEEIREQ